MNIPALNARSAILFAALVCAPLVQAQNGMTEEQMQKMMANAGKLQTCMQNIDPTVMQRIEEKGNAIQTEIKTLCATGKRDEALQKAMVYGKEMSESGDFKQLRDCGEMAVAMAPGFIANNPGNPDAGHVCDAN
jgi:hypothetical protein